jgi:glycine cleavage system H protein
MTFQGEDNPMAVVKYTKDHEYIRVEGDVGTVGITDYAQAQLGDVVFVELPEAGKALSKGAEAAVVESVKAASEIYAPVSGEVIEVNGGLPDAPATVNEDPEGKGWFLKIKLSNPAELDGLMDEAAYRAMIG